jgi:hypothetical protein
LPAYGFADRRRDVSSAASAVIVPDGPYAGPAVAPAPVVSHGGSNSDLAVWIVLLIAVGAVAAGVCLGELVRQVARRQKGRRRVLAGSY